MDFAIPKPFYPPSPNDPGNYSVLRKSPSPPITKVFLNLNYTQTTLFVLGNVIKPIVSVLSFIFTPIEPLIFGGIKFIPLWLRHFLVVKVLWPPYLKLHSLTTSTSRALHPSVSESYAALTTVMWFSRLLPVTLERARFGLNQLEVMQAPMLSSVVMEHVNTSYTRVKHQFKGDGSDAMKPVNANTYVKGTFMHSQTVATGRTKVTKENRQVLVWFYGGAFLAGDVIGNLGLAQSTALSAGLDVFVVDYSLCPENCIAESFEDALRAAEWIILQSGYVVSGAQVKVLGISSGGGVALNLAREITLDYDCDKAQPATARGDHAYTKEYRSYIKGLKMPQMAPERVSLICPWVHYDYANLFPSMFNNSLHDLIVTPPMRDYVLPISPSMISKSDDTVVLSKERVRISPLGKVGISKNTKVQIICSTHEVTYDEDVALSHQLKAELGEDWGEIDESKYMCHVWCLIPIVDESKKVMGKVGRFLGAGEKAKKQPQDGN